MKKTLIIGMRLLCLMLCLLPIRSLSQLTVSPLDYISVKRNGKELRMPWTGGLNNPQFSRADLNNDGVKDLFIFDRSSELSLTFVHNGATDSLAYTFAPRLARHFPDMLEWALLRDFNCDGTTDILTSKPGSIRLYEGAFNSDSLLTFTDRDTLIFDANNGFANIYTARNGIPAITDVNGDGDIDVLAFPNLFSTLNYYENQSMETQGNCAGEEVFELVTRCWGRFYEGGANVAQLDSCIQSPMGYDATEPALRKRKHSGSTLCAYDQQNDGTKELILGNISYNTLNRLLNGGTSDSAHIVSQDTTFPSYDKSVSLPVFPAAFNVDVNNDGLKDLMVAPNSTNDDARSRACSWYYENTGTANNAQFSFQTDSFLVGEMMDLGKGAHPAIVDYNGDSLPDLVVGNYGYYDTTFKHASSLTLFENTGTDSEPSFKLITRDFAGIQKVFPSSILALHPTFGDLDDDGDIDMVLGESRGQLHYFENTAGPGNPMNFTLSQSVLGKSIDGNFSTPYLYDVDQDGALDLIVGERNGNLNYFRNEGTPSSPNFPDSATNSFFGQVDTRDPGDFSGFSSPVITTLDSTDQRYLLSGNKTGHIYLYEYIQDSVNGGRFPLLTRTYSDIDLGKQSHPTAGDLNDNDSTEVLVGNWLGGLRLYGQTPQEEPIDTTNVVADRQENRDLAIHPNPAEQKVWIDISGKMEVSSATLRFHNMRGELVYKTTLENGVTKHEIDIEDWQPGMYFCTVQMPGQILSKKLVVTD